MEDLDALLADLQSTTSHISNQSNSSPIKTQSVEVRLQPQQQSYNQVTNNWTSSKRDSVDSLEDQPPPLPPPPSQDVLDSLSGHSTQPVPGESSHTAVHSAGPAISQQGIAVDNKPNRPAMSTLSNNLSELDSLLADLNSAQFMAEVDKRNSANRQLPSPPVKMKPATMPKPTRDTSGGQPVDALLDDLQNAVPSSGRTNVPQRSMQSNFHSFGVQPAPVASSATKELDDLMASLSQFKVTGNTQSRGAGDYNNAGSPHNPPVQQSLPPQSQPARGDQLDAMLGNLQTDMSRHGVTTIPKGHCAACNKPIVGQVITALGHTWHPEHFACYHCGEELGTRNFFERDGQPYCEKDYHGLFSPRCAYCNGPILDKCITALDRTWHPEHFFCAQCGRPFQDDGFHEKDGKAYCREDYFEMFAPKCGGCSRPIMDNYISALNRQWHPECFVCAECHVSFGGGSFFDHEGLPFCETHYHAKRGSLCAGCQKPITGRCITAMYKKFHPEHFVCAFCLKQLNKGTFKEQNDKPYCHPCFVKLFG